MEKISDVCVTIVDQLGGAQTAVMVGGTYMYDNQNDEVTLSIRSMRLKANVFKVKYEAGSDTYTVRIIKVTSKDMSSVDILKDLYADQHRGLVEKYTGLRTSLTAVYS